MNSPKPLKKRLTISPRPYMAEVPVAHERWYAVKLFERDERVMAQCNFSAQTKDALETAIASVEKELDDDSESIITNERYAYIAKLMKNCVHKKRSGLSTRDKIDRVVTNRWLALPIFVVVMFVVYYISVTTSARLSPILRTTPCSANGFNRPWAAG